MWELFFKIFSVATLHALIGRHCPYMTTAKFAEQTLTASRVIKGQLTFHFFQRPLFYSHTVILSIFFWQLLTVIGVTCNCTSFSFSLLLVPVCTVLFLLLIFLILAKLNCAFLNLLYNHKLTSVQIIISLLIHPSSLCLLG